MSQVEFKLVHGQGALAKVTDFMTIYRISVEKNSNYVFTLFQL